MSIYNPALLKKQIKSLSGNEKEISIDPPEKEIKSQ
tara:strand:+ start:1885 stop:1992 length:108 start_codon:yes stop_codon:yes gene_type:complete